MVVAYFNVSALQRLEGLNKITKYLSRFLNFMIGIETRISQIRSRSAKLSVPLLYVMSFYTRRNCHPFVLYVSETVCRTEERAYTGVVQKQNTEEDIHCKRDEMAEEVS